MRQFFFPVLVRLVAVVAISAPCLLFAQERGEPVGSVVNSRGATAHDETGTIRFLGKGDRIYKGDVISTAARSFAVVTMADDTKLTVRPSSVLRVNEFSVKPKKENVLISLFRGGLRALTGFISKRRSNAFRVRTSVATIGIRGTEFDARLCEQSDCTKEAAKLKGKKRFKRTSKVVGRVVARRGRTLRETPAGKSVPVTGGAPVVAGDVLTTGKASFMVVVYRDGSRMTLLADTRFQVEALESAGRASEDTASPGAATPAKPKVQSKAKAKPPRQRAKASGKQRARTPAKKAKRENAVFRLFRGGLRVITGLIGKRNPRGFRIRTGIATIGIRGTAFDVVCAGGDCAGGQGVFVRTRQGTATLNDNPIAAGQVASFAQGAFQFVKQLPQNLTPPEQTKPEGFKVDEKGLFKQSDVGEAKQGLYVAVRSGHAEADGVHLGKGEALYKGTEEPAQRLVEIPAFLTGDPFLNSEQLQTTPPTAGSPVTAPETCAVP